MSADPAEGIKDLLVAGGIGVFNAPSGWAIHIGPTPLDKDQVILCNVTGGRPPSPKWLLDFPSVQVLIRGRARDYAAARAKAYAVRDALLGLPSQDLNGDRWVAINQIGDVNYLGQDQNGRPAFSLNFALIIEPAAGGYRQAIT